MHQGTGNWDELVWEEVAPGFERKVRHGVGMTLVLVRFAPGAGAPVHSHPHEQFSCVVSGTGVFSVDGHETPVGPNDVLHFQGGLEHGVTVGKDGMVVMDIFTPCRDDFPASAKAG